jgi:hypothetical protein
LNSGCRELSIPLDAVNGNIADRSLEFGALRCHENAG